MNELFVMIGAGYASVFLMMFVLWVIHLIIKNAAVVDVGWGLGFIFISCIYLALGEPTLRSRLMFIMVVLWGVRIVYMLIKRIRREKHEDKRYQKLRQDWGGNLPLKFFFFFQFQAVLQIIMSAPILIACLNSNPDLSGFEIVGFVIWALALMGETISDRQLEHFKMDPTNKGKVCNIGFWNYSRHPNYFFEWLVWVGIFIFTLGSPNAWWGIISPIIIYILVTKVSGVPMAEEQSLKSRGDLYREYQKTTSVFFPLPKRK